MTGQPHPAVAERPLVPAPEPLPAPVVDAHTHLDACGAHTPEPFEPIARESPPPQAAAAPVPLPAEPPKRRSTVREPAPMFSSGAMSDVHPSAPAAPEPAPAPPEPVVTEAPAASAEDAKPRRFGWWSRRG